MKLCVIGGSSGIGLSTVELALARGDDVTSVSRRPSPIQHARLTSQALDVTQHALSLKGFDAAVYCAGVAQHEPIGAITNEALRTMIDTNFIAALRVGERAIAELNTGGALVLISSTLAHRPLAHTAAYSATKAAMIAMSKSLALAGQQRDLRVNTVSPGLVDTPMIAGRPPTNLPIGKPSDIARAILALIDQPYLTGSDLVIDGGLLMRE